ncbi:hypothetical protein BSKO_06254 [Bryopsis sp. KO-2023]|nr:hypothetical protein BSKO_06254 [Bryopsis sp. KO-2023]
MVGNGPALISAVVERLKPDDVELLLGNRGLPSVGTKEELSERLQGALIREICEWSWEKGMQPAHAEIIAAGASMVENNGSIYVFGGMDEERNEHMGLWKWDLAGSEGFQTVSYKGPVPQTFNAGCYAAVYKGELWVFPGPRNQNMRNVYCCELTRYRWVERAFQGEPPCETQMRRNVDCFLWGQKLVVMGGGYMDRVYIFDFEARLWMKQRTKPPPEKPALNFGGSCLYGGHLYAYGASKRKSEELMVEVWKLGLGDWTWTQVSSNGTTPPPFRIHASCAVVGSKWIVHGGRRPNMSKFNVSDQTFVFDLEEHRWSILMAEGHQPIAREWHTALGVGDKMIVVGGRVDIPDYEPIPLSFDTMCMDVEIVHYQASPPPREPTGRANVLWMYRKLYNDSYLSDVTLIVGEKSIPAHCHVLASHSSVFERMWGSWMKEAETREVVIQDVPLDTMVCVVKYMYGVLDEIPQDHEAVVELFKAADKYNIKGLVNECVVMFRKLTGKDTIASLLEVAEERSHDELRKVCEEIALKHLSYILLTQSFKELTQRNPDLALPFVSKVLAAILGRQGESESSDSPDKQWRRTEF